MAKFSPDVVIILNFQTIDINLDDKNVEPY